MGVRPYTKRTFYRMRARPALLSSIGSRVVGAIFACGLAMLACGVLLQAGKQQRQYRQLHQQQLRQTATLAALTVNNRIAAAKMLLVSGMAAGQDDLLRQRLHDSPVFEHVEFIDATSALEVDSDGHHYVLPATARDELATGQVTRIRDADSGSLALLGVMPERASVRWVLARISSGWLWSFPGINNSSPVLVAMDAGGQQLFSSAEREGAATTSLPSLLQDLPAQGEARDVSWLEQDKPWVGALAAVAPDTVLIAADADHPWSVAFWSAMRTQVTALAVLLLLAGVVAHLLTRHHVDTFHLQRKALAQLPSRRVPVQSSPALSGELRALVDTYNRTAEDLEAQVGIHKAVDEIDGLLLAGGDHENVIDQVLMRIRDITRANNVGLTLVEPDVAGHGRMFAVDVDGGCPVSRVAMDEQMVETLRTAQHGLTVARFEAGRHSFLEPLQSAGSSFFWVWPVSIDGQLAAVLAVGYVEPPANGARVAGCGTHCAQRLSVALSGRARAEHLYRQAHFDPLTQLPNRLLFRDQLAQELKLMTDTGGRGALLYIDLDHFKKVNDSMGHAAGDQVLAIVAQRLRACVKDGDTVARLGGDEFTVILRNITDITTVSTVADRMIHSIQQPMQVGRSEQRVRASIGIALFPLDGSTLEELMRCADVAMYSAKEAGRGAAVFYNSKMTERTAPTADSGLYRAVTRREFSIYFQPQYSMHDGSMVGVEALLRWQRPRVGMVSPEYFIPAAEEAGLIVDLGGWVIDAVCAQIAQWRQQGFATPRVAINLSAQQLRDPLLAESLQRSLERHRLVPSVLEFEMNEASLTNPDSQDTVAALSALGVQLTLDDFGTGHTALANLRRYPVRAVKIDRSFVEKLTADASAATLASTIIVMAHSLGKQVIAEGVETVEQLDYLRERGCDFAQGYFMAQPLAAQDMTDLLAGHKSEITGEHSAFA